MDIDRLRYFTVVAETGNLRKAAELLRISPAALSKSIKVLESELGVRLLLPSGRGIVLSEEGRRVSENALRILEEVAALKEKSQARSAVKPYVIGSFEVFTTYFAGPLLKEHLDGTSVLFRECVPGELESALVNREIDIGITYVPIPLGGVEHIEITSVDMGVFGRKEIFGRTPFRDLPFIIPVQPLRGAPTKVQGLDGWPDGRVVRKVAFKVSLMETALELCRQGLAVAYLPAFVVSLHNGQHLERYRLDVLEKPRGVGTGRQAVYIARRKTDAEDTETRRIARALRAICAAGRFP